MGETSNIRRYEGRGCSVTYDAKRCIHAAECARGLPAVFDSKAKPWIRPAETEADVLAPVIERCPSGALKLERADGTSEPVPTRNTATLTPDGPTYLRGDVELVGADGTVAMIDTGGVVSLRCIAEQAVMRRKPPRRGIPPSGHGSGG